MADEEMVRVNLSNTVGARAPGQRRPSKFYGPGEGVLVPQSLALSLGLRPLAAPRAGTSGGALPNKTDAQEPEGLRLESGDQELEVVGAQQAQEEQEAKRQAARGGTEQAQESGGNYDEWKVSDLQDEAEFRGLQVKRADGDGAPLKADFIRALEESDRQGGNEAQ